MLSLYFVPLGIICFGGISQIWQLFALFILSGLGMAGIGMGIMHDALHGSYSKSKTLNKWMGYTMNLIGASDEVWKLQHNVLHHSFTNIEEHDDDINAPFFLRFSPHAKRNRLHPYQHYYVWLFYGLSTISWITSKDFIRLNRYRKLGLIKGKAEYKRLLLRIIFWKFIYFSYVLVLPLLLTSLAPWIVILAFLSMHFVTGLCISIVFQTAHVMPDTSYPLPDGAGKLEHERLVHQLTTTCNFAPRSKWFSWLIGGLNFQIEHHLFPHISHVHYRHLAPIVKKTTEEFGIPYYSYSTFFSAIKSHGIMLRQLGSMPCKPTT
ncbi:acyl-CoA desaturase [Niabella yanshanensis]|uniref:Acyl-CoA desaturase n=1 Tax=Niabella yanshanensis TaxID=577386 RepID=A0ABZ0WA81_9BACT|nr:acyl-CoA desaturase [Niabella yanshanensis]WQD39402.1 acyl-CoA desaturase [Niabella yanshanensis]